MNATPLPLLRPNPGQPTPLSKAQLPGGLSLTHSASIVFLSVFGDGREHHNNAEIMKITVCN